MSLRARWVLPAALCLAAIPAAAETVAWDRGQDPVSQLDWDWTRPPSARRPTMRIFLAPPQDAPGLRNAVESFLTSFILKEQLDEALHAHLSKRIDDMGLIPAEALLDSTEYWDVARGYRNAALPLPRATVEKYWSRHLEMLLDDLKVRGPSAPRTLDEALAPLRREGGFVAELAEKFAARKEPFLPLFLGARMFAYPVKKWEDIAWFAELCSDTLSPGYKSLLPELIHARRLDMRAVVAVRRLPTWNDTQYALEMVMLWAAEPEGWKLWALLPHEHYIPGAR